MPLSPPEQLAHSTVRIECLLADGRIGTGTGFFYALDRTEQEYVPVIITNKHVVAGAVRGKFVLTLRDDQGEPSVGKTEVFEFDNFDKLWVSHPDASIDLVAIPIASILNTAETRGIGLFCPPMDKSLIPTDEDVADLIGLESVTMVGYPNGLWDKENNLPIFRRGIMATDYKYNWNGRKEFLIDAACFPGSSGSPVLLFDLGSFQSKKGNFFGPSRVKLLGVLYAGPQQTVQGEIEVVDVPTQQKAIALSGIPINLGVVIKARELLAFEGLFKKTQ